MVSGSRQTSTLFLLQSLFVCITECRSQRMQDFITQVDLISFIYNRKDCFKNSMGDLSYPNTAFGISESLHEASESSVHVAGLPSSWPSVYYEKSIGLLLETLCDLEISKDAQYACKKVFDRLLEEWASPDSAQFLVQAISTLARDALQQKEQNFEGANDLQKAMITAEDPSGQLLQRVSGLLVEELQVQTPYWFLKKIEHFGGGFVEQIESVIDYSLLLSELVGVSAQNIFLGCSAYYFHSRHLPVSTTSQVVAGVARVIANAYQADLEELE